MASSWDTPITSLEPSWHHQLLPYYEAIVRFIAPLRGEAIVERVWPQCKDILDLEPQPTSLMVANDRWRGFVGGVWGMYEGYVQRKGKR